MVGCSMLRDIHSRLCEIMQCQDKPFGGMCVVLMGDFVQLTPVGQTDFFGSVKVQVGGQDLNDVFGRVKMHEYGIFRSCTLFKKGMFSVGKWAFPCCCTKHWLGSTSMDWAVVQVDFV